MLRILFVCHGNICRSVAAEMVLRQMVEEAGLAGRIAVDSAAATDEEIGHGIYPPMRRALEAAGVPCRPHEARRITRGDYSRCDCLIGMDRENLSDMRFAFGGDPAGKITLLMDWAGQAGREIDDPWYTRDFSGCLSEIQSCCGALLEHLCRGETTPRA
ncbi:MAG: low molecular weight phosphotyrosine protein phosphatase [Clostridia bacterium]|nr:low molecular weight phosphotyrosine protein phosphatase [Clostridia bacterium]